MNLGPKCPECGRHIPFKRTMWGLGKAFDCDICGTALVIPKQFFVPLAAFAGWYAIKPESDSLWMHAATLAPFFAGVALYSVVAMKPRKVNREAPR